MPRLLPLVVAAALAPSLGAQPSPFTVDDLVVLERISDPQVSPDGRWIVFVVRSTDLEENRGRTDLWWVGVDGKDLRRLTSHKASDSNPRWSPDGRGLYFLSTRSGSSQVWRLPRQGGEAAQVTDLPLDVANLEVSPDGERLGLTMEVFPDCDTLACTAERLEEREESKASGRIYDRLLVRHWDTWKEGRRSHLFVVPVDGGEPLDVTQGLDADIPSKPFGGSEEFTFTADGRALVFTARVAGVGEAWSTNFDLYLVPADGSQSPRSLTSDNPAWDTHPVFSPDGKSLAYLAMKRSGYESDRFRLVLRGWPRGEERVLAGAWDRSVRDFAFSGDGRTLYATARDAGQVPLFAIDVESGRVEELVAEGTVRSPSPAGDRIVFGRDDLTSPVELYSIARNGRGLRQLTRINGERLAGLEMGEAEQFAFDGWNGETAHGYVVKPARFEATAKYPVTFIIHGGPQGSSSNDFHYRWNPQIYAGAGYAVVMIDFHGSTGYGQEFTDSIRGDWGGKPFVDLQEGLAAALERYPFLDGERICALGASYGGYMINWIAGNWPDRFRCLVNHDGLFDLRMMYYTTEELWFLEWDHLAPYYENPDMHERHNPALHVQRWRTPMLVIHGALDYRVPETQGLATFTSLQRRRIPSRLLYFPDENHWVLKPHNSIQWHQEVLAWLERWLREK